jgi:hypothetical protein
MAVLLDMLAAGISEVWCGIVTGTMNNSSYVYNTLSRRSKEKLGSLRAVNEAGECRRKSQRRVKAGHSLEPSPALVGRVRYPAVQSSTIAALPEPIARAHALFPPGDHLRKQQPRLRCDRVAAGSVTPTRTGTTSAVGFRDQYNTRTATVGLYRSQSNKLQHLARSPAVSLQHLPHDAADTKPATARALISRIVYTSPQIGLVV